jgi:hypothetical protein
MHTGSGRVSLPEKDRAGQSSVAVILMVDCCIILDCDRPKTRGAMSVGGGMNEVFLMCMSKIEKRIQEYLQYRSCI